MKTVSPDKGGYIEILSDSIYFDPVEWKSITTKKQFSFTDYTHSDGEGKVPEEMDIYSVWSMAEQFQSVESGIVGRVTMLRSISESSLALPCTTEPKRMIAIISLWRRSSLMWDVINSGPHHYSLINLKIQFNRHSYMYSAVMCGRSYPETIWHHIKISTWVYYPLGILRESASNGWKVSWLQKLPGIFGLTDSESTKISRHSMKSFPPVLISIGGRNNINSLTVIGPLHVQP